MVDIVHLALPVAQLHQRAHAGHDILAVERALRVGLVEVEAHVHLDPPHGRKVIAFGIEEERLEKRGRGFLGGRLAGAHHAVDVHERAFAVHVLVRRHGIADIGADIHAVDVEHRDLGDARIQQILKRAARDRAVAIVFERELVARLDIDRAGFLVDDVARRELAHDAVEGHQQFGHLALVDELLDRARRDLLARLEQHLAGLGVHYVIGRTGAADAVGEEFRDPALLLLQLVGDGVVIGIHDAFLVKPEGVEQGRHRQLAAAVDAGEHEVLGVELEIEPGAAIGDDPAGEEQLARAVRLALVMVEEHAGAAVHLAHDHALGAVDDEGAVRGHERHVAHEHILLLDVLDRFRAGILVHLEDDQPQLDLERRGIGHVALHAFLDVVFGLFQLVAHEFQHAGLVEILDREDRLEHALDPLAVLRLGSVARVEEQVIGGFLHLDEVRHLEDFADLAVIPAQALLAKVALSHDRSHLSFLTGRGRCRAPAPRASERAGRSIPGRRPNDGLPIA